MKSFFIKTSHGAISVQPTENEHTFLLNSLIDGYSVVAKKDLKGKWCIVNGNGLATPEMTRHAEEIGKLIDESLLFTPLGTN